MKKLLPFLLLLLSSPVVGQQALESMVTAEKAFARHADSVSTKAAFIKFLGDSAIIFTPAPTLGQPYFQNLPNGAKSKLYWHPAYAVASASGDMGLTTGPSLFQPDPQDSSSWRYGHFVSVWQKDATGNWKNIADIGNHHIDPGKVPLTYPQSYTLKSPKKPTAKGTKANLLNTDKGFTSYGDYITENTALYREGSLPAFKNTQELVKQEATRFELWQPLYAAVSEAGEFGYTYGQYSRQSGKKGYYLRIWHMTPKGWKLLIESLNKES